MKNHGILLAALFSALILLAGQAQAAAQEWQFDTAHSRTYFTIDHIFSKVIGFFEDYSGTFYFDPDNLAESSIVLQIKTDSINTNIVKRDNHLRTDDFFDVKKYPLMSFRSTRIYRDEGNRYFVEGDMTIKDVTKRVTVPLIYFGVKDNPLKEGQSVAGFESRFTIDRLEYHVGSGKFYQMGVVGKDVELLITLEMLRDK